MPRILRAAFFLVAPVFLVFLITQFFPPRATDGVHDIGSLTGTWMGDFAWLDGSQTFPVSITIKADGSYVFDSVYRETNGRILLEGGRVFLSVEGEQIGSPLARGLNSGQPTLEGGIENIGRYHFGKVN
ncbi:MAG: hypothetical protein HOC91_09105 [Nitrospinaceae bacterium]|nr:hypothetical protein [Nitrospinaceae bacterium]MBT4093144.1 hypothetical protein [Nitrospinaceae bacterium]MBT4430657.1 hypothetical protein [Nitrospinaceae bacterium]MBT5369733.1 hypothetical protein [Nitrospinaceae bacterium]MBT5949069.1 hypothetical protein [Nitrospinaceae bacterium]